jgi:F-type H+-transporting ATPase subunit a
MEAPAKDAGAGGGVSRFLTRRTLGCLVLAVLALDVLAYVAAPPAEPGAASGTACAYPVCFIDGNLELPAPHVIVDLDPANPTPTGPLVVGFWPSITSTLFTMWIVILLVLGMAIVMTRRRDVIPGRLQNAAELAYESLENFALSLGGERARPYVPWFAGLFIFIVAGNWIGLVSPVGKLEELRAPTSDVNVTVGLALVSFTVFQAEGFRKLGVGGYLGKFFPLSEFRNGVGAGVIALFVGLIELLLEFIKPVTLSMRLFGNIYGGEVALGVVTGLTVAILPVALYGLEFLLNLVQALIFSVLSLMFILIATEGPRPAGTCHARQPLEGVVRHHQTPGEPRRQEGEPPMDHLGAGLAALGVIGPGIGIGILAGLSSSAISRNPDAASQIRGLAIILAAFAEGLGVLAVVVGLLAIFIK